MKRKNFTLRKWLALFCMAFLVSHPSRSQVNVGGVNLGNLPSYLLVFTDGSVDANWQGASKGFSGDVAVDGKSASLRTSGKVPFAGTIYTNNSTLGAWQSIVSSNPGQAFASLNQTARISGLESDLENAFSQINGLAVTPGYNSVSATSLNGLNTQNGVGQTFVINVTSGFQVSSQIKITGDANDFFVLRWDNDANFSNGYNGQVKFQSGGAIVPLGGLIPTNFVHVAGDINCSGGGSTPAPPYPQGPRSNNGTGPLITGAADFGGGGFFTGYWLTTGTPTIFTPGRQPYGQTSPFSNGIITGGWYSKTTKFSMTSGTSGVYVCPPTSLLCIGDFVWDDTEYPVFEGNGYQDPGEPGMPNIPVRLYKDTNTGTPIQTTVTDANGKYQFNSLLPGTYIVEVVMPSTNAQGAPYWMPSQYTGGEPNNRNNTDNNGVNWKGGGAREVWSNKIVLKAGDNCNGSIDFGLVDPPSPVFAAMLQHQTDAREESYRGFKVSGVYPNPFSDRLVVNYSSETAQPVFARIMSNDGKMVYNQKVAVSAGRNTIQLYNIGRLAPGVYMVELIGGTSRYTQRLIRK